MKTPRLYIISILGILCLFPQRAHSDNPPSWIPAFMAVTGSGMAAMWTIDIIRADKIDTQNGILRAREPGSESWLLPHWIAEYSTAGLLLAGAYGLQNNKAWGRDVSLVALGSLNYTALNSLGWALGKKERTPYAIPMILSLTGSTISLCVIF